MQQQQELGTKSIGKLLLSLSLPAIAAQVVNLLYNVVDRMYIGRIEGIGTQALTGVGVAFPIIILISAFAGLIGMGGAPLASIRMGSKDHKGAEKIMGNCVSMMIVAASILTIVFTIWNEPILYAFGASDATIPYALQYIQIYVLGTIFVLFSLGLNNFINAQGFAKVGMQTVVIGAIINIVLDPILIFVFDMGVQGAALATIISQGVSAVWVMLFLTGKKCTLKIRKVNLKLDLHIVGKVVALGISPFIMQATECLINIVFNTQLLAMGGDLYVGAMVIMSSISQFVMMPMMGVTQGAQPIIGYNYGAKQYSRVKKTVKLALMVAMSYTIVMWSICIFAPQLLTMIFSSDVELRAITEQAMRIYFFGILMMGAQIVCQNAFVALGQAKISMLLALLRKIILLIPLVYIIPRITNLGVNGIFLAQPIADIMAALTTATTFFFISKKILADKTPDVPLEKK